MKPVEIDFKIETFPSKTSIDVLSPGQKVLFLDVQLSSEFYISSTYLHAFRVLKFCMRNVAYVRQSMSLLNFIMG